MHFVGVFCVYILDVSTSSNPATDIVTLFIMTATTTATGGSSSSTTLMITPNSTFSLTLTTSTINQNNSLFMTSSISMETGIPQGNRNGNSIQYCSILYN